MREIGCERDKLTSGMRERETERERDKGNKLPLAGGRDDVAGSEHLLDVAEVLLVKVQGDGEEIKLCEENEKNEGEKRF